MDAFVDIAPSMDIIQHLRGFSTNVANYQSFGYPCTATNEHNYARLLTRSFERLNNWKSHVVIDTARNGDDDDVRSDCSNWCNVRDARVGEGRRQRPVIPPSSTHTFGSRHPGNPTDVRKNFLTDPSVHVLIRVARPTTPSDAGKVNPGAPKPGTGSTIKYVCLSVVRLPSHPGSASASSSSIIVTINNHLNSFGGSQNDLLLSDKAVRY